MVNFNRDNWPPFPEIKVFGVALISLHVRSNYLLKTEEVTFRAKFCFFYMASEIRGNCFNHMIGDNLTSTSNSVLPNLIQLLPKWKY